MFFQNLFPELNHFPTFFNFLLFALFGENEKLWAAISSHTHQDTGFWGSCQRSTKQSFKKILIFKSTDLILPFIMLRRTSLSSLCWSVLCVALLLSVFSATRSLPLIGCYCSDSTCHDVTCMLSMVIVGIIATYGDFSSYNNNKIKFDVWIRQSIQCYQVMIDNLWILMTEYHTDKLFVIVIIRVFYCPAVVGVYSSYLWPCLLSHSPLHTRALHVSLQIRPHRDVLLGHQGTRAQPPGRRGHFPLDW